MIDEGHLQPAARTDSLLVVREGKSWSARLKNVACSEVIENRELVESTQEHFCNFVQGAEKIKAPDDAGRSDQRACVHGFHKLCNDMFDNLNDGCPNTGGVAEASLAKNGKEVEKGKVEAFWANQDGDCTPTKTISCHEHSV
ncbi:hypothetical protein GGR53DRAFT_532011 [Hypoxylon sp. FL1150]|nr:hypothetical protein GGR53DRAFT_532011 [Hypoxylon sp. FL1150]